MTETVHSTTLPAAMNGQAKLPKKLRSKPLRITAQRRQRMEEIVDGLLRLMDELDGETDEEPSTSFMTDLGVPSGAWDECEPEPVEPSLGSLDPTGVGIDQRNWTLGDWEDREWEHDGGEPDVDDEPAGDENEPSLGAIEIQTLCYPDWQGNFSRERVGVDQSDWSKSGTTDAEGDDSDHEDNGDREHAMTDDNGIADAGGIDTDAEPDDNGIADDGGVQEQFGGMCDGRFNGSGNRIAEKQLADLRRLVPTSYELTWQDGRGFMVAPVQPGADR